MAKKEKAGDVKKDDKPSPAPATELKTKWVTDSVDEEHDGKILNENKKK